MAAEPRNEQEGVQRFSAMRQEVQQLGQKVIEIDAELQVRREGVARQRHPRAHMLPRSP